MSFERPKFKVTVALTPGFNQQGVFSFGDMGGAGVFTNSYYFESPEFILSLANTTAGALVRAFIVSPGAGSDIAVIMVNPSGHDPSTGNDANSYRCWFDYASRDAAAFKIYGGAFGWGEAVGNRVLCFYDSGTSAANHVFSDNITRSISTGGYSQAPAIDTLAEWIAAVDANAREGASTLFPNAPTNLAFTKSSLLATIYRATSSPIPAGGGIDTSNYNGRLGAYQGVPPATLGTLDATGRLGRGRNWR